MSEFLKADGEWKTSENEINAFEKNGMVFNVKSPGKFIFKIDGKVVKIIQKPFYKRLWDWLKKDTFKKV